MGLYASVVLVIGKFVREFFSGISHSIMFEELPCVDRILKLCTDIFLVRETGELELEEDLYAKLIFLYRSPETMIKWTREKTKWASGIAWKPKEGSVRIITALKTVRNKWPRCETPPATMWPAGETKVSWLRLDFQKLLGTEAILRSSGRW